MTIKYVKLKNYKKMKPVKLIENNGKITYYINAEYYYEAGDIVIREYDEDEHGGYHLACNHRIPETEVQEIKYEG